MNGGGRDLVGNGTVVYRVGIDIEQGGAEAAGDVGLCGGGELLDVLFEAVALGDGVMVAVRRGGIDDVVSNVVVGGDAVSTKYTFVDD